MSGQIYELIPKVMGDIGAVGKNRKNEQQKYAFRGIEDMYLAAHPAFVKHGVFCAPEVVERTEYRFEKVNDYGKTTTWVHVMLKVVHRFYAPDGSFVSVTTIGEGLDNSDKASNKAMSGAVKYALITLFSVPTEDIEDSDRATLEAGVKRSGPIAEPITLTPVTPGKEPEGKTLEERIDNKYITPSQVQYLSRRFRESVRAEKQNECEEARHACLGALELTGKFKSRFLDEHGNPTSKLILTSEYDAIGKALVRAAKSL